MAGENNNIFHYQKVELEDDEEEDENLAKNQNAEKDRNELSRTLGSSKPRRRGTRNCCILLLVMMLSGAGVSGYASYNFYFNKHNQTDIMSTLNVTKQTTRSVHILNATSIVVTNASTTTLAPRINSTNSPTNKSRTYTTINHMKLHTPLLERNTTNESTTGEENNSHNKEWYKKYWEKYSNPHRWDWILLGLVVGISSTIALFGFICMYCLCKSRRRMRRRHFERLLKDINASEKFSLVNSSEDEDSDP